jgi:uncharacterized protein (DUF885 family)
MTDIFALSEGAVDRVAADNPLLATELGLTEHNGSWPDLSPDGVAATRDLLAGLRAEAQACEVPDDRHRLAQRVLVEHCDALLARHDAGGPYYDLNNIAGPHQDLRFVFGSMPDQTIDDWEHIITRVEKIAEPLDGYRRTLEEGRRQGRTVSRRQVETVIEQGRTAASDNSSFDELRRNLAEAPIEGGALADRLDRAIATAKQAFLDFNDYLADTYLPSAVEADAVGEERYLLAAAIFLGTELDPHATYRWGWDEVERLWAETQAACAAIDADAPAAAVIQRLRTDPAYAVDSADEFIDLMRDRQEQALHALEGVHFDVPEQIRTVDVQVEPPGGASAAHYVPPSEDFSRPGSVWYPIAGQSHFPLFQEVTIAYHEGFPGHHLQIGVQVTRGEELSRFHRTLVWYPGSGEGWALYAEHLMGELGYLERPEYVVGLLSSQVMRACRVAIDIGTHLELPIPDDVTFHPGERWSFELAHELLTERGLVDADMATSEVIRYFGWPAQAISYKLGEQAILDLRAEARARDGDCFDPKAFHAKLLEVGSVGLDLLRDHVRG